MKTCFFIRTLQNLKFNGDKKLWLWCDIHFLLKCVFFYYMCTFISLFFLDRLILIFPFFSEDWNMECLYPSIRVFTGQINHTCQVQKHIYSGRKILDIWGAVIDVHGNFGTLLTLWYETGIALSNERLISVRYTLTLSSKLSEQVISWLYNSISNYSKLIRLRIR